MNSFHSRKNPDGQTIVPYGAGPVPVVDYASYRDYRYPPFDQVEEDGIDPLKILWYVVHYRWLIITFLTLGLVAGSIYTYTRTPLYRASATVEILSSGAKVLQDLQAVAQSTDWRAYETARLKVASRAVAQRVVYELDLADKPDFLAPRPSFSLVNLVDKAMGKDNRIDLGALSPQQRQNMAIGRVLGGLSADLVKDSSLMSIHYSHPDPKYAASVVNQVARSFINQDIDRASEKSDLARQFIQQQVQETKVKLQASEKALVDYANKEGITLTGNDASLIADNIANLNAALAAAIEKRVAAERFHDQVAAGNAATLPEVFQSAPIQETESKIAELKASYREKLNRLKPGFPEMRQIQLQIAELQKQVKKQIDAIAQGVETRYQQAKDTETALKKELADLERQQQAFQKKYIQYTILKRDVDSNRTQYDSLIAKLNEVGVGSQLKTTNASIVDLAVPPGGPYYPRLSRFLLMALAFAGVLAAGLIYLLELMNNNFTLPDQIESELRLPVLGIIPVPAKTSVMEAFDDNKSALSEAYRTLRTSLQFTGTENEMRTLLVTSSDQGEGKSTTSYKLAKDFAALGRRVLVIDADLRKPQVHRLFKTANAMGLSNLLSNVVRSGGPSIFQGTDDPKITILPAGTIPPNPVELLSSARMGMVLHYCAKRYDLVIIDGPPVMGLSDAPILSRIADATVMVIASGQVSRRAVKAALARLKSASANVVGAAFTKFSIDTLDYNYAHRFMHYDYYNYYDRSQIEDHGAQGTEQASVRHLFGAVISRLRSRFGSHAA